MPRFGLRFIVTTVALRRAWPPPRRPRTRRLPSASAASAPASANLTALGSSPSRSSRSFVQDAFKDQPVKLQWDYFSGTGPAINEAFANQQLDFAQYGGLPSVIARANGVAMRRSSCRAAAVTNLYGVARTGLPIQSVKDLKGYKGHASKGHHPAMVAAPRARGERP